MNDPVLRHLLWARRVERSALGWLLWRRGPLLGAGVADRVETVWARATIRSQHERVEEEGREAPASASGSIPWVGQARPTRPPAGHFVEREERFDLEPTRRSRRCESCSGEGQVPCGVCEGSGRTFCRQGPSCPRCQRGDKPRCQACGGGGRQRCARCGGEGRIIGWTSVRYLWSVVEQHVEVSPLRAPSPRLRRTEAALARRAEDAVPAFDTASLRARLGSVSEEARVEVEEAARRTFEAERQVESLCGRCLHWETERWMLPVRALVSRLSGTGSAHVLLGGGADPVEVSAPLQPDPWKLAGWAQLLPGTLLVGLALRLPSPALGALALGVLTLGLVCLVVGVLIERRTPVIAVLAEETPTRYLPLLAHVGAAERSVLVPDDLESALLAGLLGAAGCAGASALVIARADGRRLRLVEPAGPDLGSPGVWQDLLSAVDGVILVAQGAQSAWIVPLARVVARRGLPVVALPGGTEALEPIAESWLASGGAGSREIFAWLWAPVGALEAACLKERA